LLDARQLRWVRTREMRTKGRVSVIRPLDTILSQRARPAARQPASARERPLRTIDGAKSTPEMSCAMCGQAVSSAVDYKRHLRAAHAAVETMGADEALTAPRAKPEAPANVTAPEHSGAPSPSRTPWMPAPWKPWVRDTP